MKFKIDENLGPQIRDLFIAAGHDALTVHDQSISGIADPALVRVCTTESRTLVTMDKELASVVLYPPGTHAGVILLRVSTSTPEAELAMLVPLVIDGLKSNNCFGATWVVSARGVRIYSGRAAT